jgi:hypothetical protein
MRSDTRAASATTFKPRSSLRGEDRSGQARLDGRFVWDLASYAQANPPPQVAQLLPSRDMLRHSVPFENNMSRLTRKSVFRSAVVLVLLGILMGLVTLTNPSAMLMATATLLIGVVMIAIASFADL